MQHLYRFPSILRIKPTVIVVSYNPGGTSAPFAGFAAQSAPEKSEAVNCHGLLGIIKWIKRIPCKSAFHIFIFIRFIPNGVIFIIYKNKLKF